jgi:hypothetical protein
VPVGGRIAEFYIWNPSRNTFYYRVCADRRGRGGENGKRMEGSRGLPQVVTECDPELLKRRVHLVRHGLR